MVFINSLEDLDKIISEIELPKRNVSFEEEENDPGDV